MTYSIQVKCSHCSALFERYPISTARAARPQFCSKNCQIAERNSRAVLGVESRFWSKVDISGGVEGCWPWTGRRDSHDYGRFDIGGRPELAHRFAFKLCHGKLLAGQNVLHRCDNPPCCNPAHHFVGTQADNVADMIAKGRKAPPQIRRGEANNQAKLTEAQVLKIITSEEPNGTLAAQYFVSSTTIYWIRKGRNWRHMAEADQ